MTARRPRSITPQLQFMVICESIEHDEDGNVSFRRIFDTAQVVGPTPIQIAFTVSVQFRSGTGGHTSWLRIVHPRGIESTTDEVSFTLNSKAAAHRIDSRLRMGLGDDDFGKFDITVVLDGREVVTTPLSITHRSSVPRKT
jgi:hypothetical protein